MAHRTMNGGLRRTLVLSGVLATSAVMAVGAPVAAQDVEREARGRCTGTSRWELSLEKEYGRIEVDLEIDTARRGRAWKVVLHHDGTQIVNRQRRTDREGEIDLRRLRRDTPGLDRFSFKAIDRVNGEVCRGKLSI